MQSSEEGFVYPQTPVQAAPSDERGALRALAFTSAQQDTAVQLWWNFIACFIAARAAV